MALCCHVGKEGVVELTLRFLELLLEKRRHCVRLHCVFSCSSATRYRFKTVSCGGRKRSNNTRLPSIPPYWPVYGSKIQTQLFRMSAEFSLILTRRANGSQMRILSHFCTREPPPVDPEKASDEPTPERLIPESEPELEPEQP